MNRVREGRHSFDIHRKEGLNSPNPSLELQTLRVATPSSYRDISGRRLSLFRGLGLQMDERNLCKCIQILALATL